MEATNPLPVMSYNQYNVASAPLGAQPFVDGAPPQVITGGQVFPMLPRGTHVYLCYQSPPQGNSIYNGGAANGVPNVPFAVKGDPQVPPQPQSQLLPSQTQQPPAGVVGIVTQGGYTHPQQQQQQQPPPPPPPPHAPSNRPTPDTYMSYPPPLRNDNNPSSASTSISGESVNQGPAPSSFVVSPGTLPSHLTPSAQQPSDQRYVPDTMQSQRPPAVAPPYASSLVFRDDSALMPGRPVSFSQPVELCSIPPQSTPVVTTQYSNQIPEVVLPRAANVLSKAGSLSEPPPVSASSLPSSQLVPGAGSHSQCSQPQISPSQTKMEDSSHGVSEVTAPTPKRGSSESVTQSIASSEESLRQIADSPTPPKTQQDIAYSPKIAQRDSVVPSLSSQASPKSRARTIIPDDSRNYSESARKVSTSSSVGSSQGLLGSREGSDGSISSMPNIMSPVTCGSSYLPPGLAEARSMFPKNSATWSDRSAEEQPTKALEQGSPNFPNATVKTEPAEESTAQPSMAAGSSSSTISATSTQSTASAPQGSVSAGSPRALNSSTAPVPIVQAALQPVQSPQPPAMQPSPLSRHPSEPHAQSPHTTVRQLSSPETQRINQFPLSTQMPPVNSVNQPQHSPQPQVLPMQGHPPSMQGQQQTLPQPPLVQQPSGQQQMAQQPLAQQPLAQQPLAQQPLAQQPTMQQSSMQQQQQQPTMQQPAMQQPPIVHVPPPTQSQSQAGPSSVPLGMVPCTNHIPSSSNCKGQTAVSRPRPRHRDSDKPQHRSWLQQNRMYQDRLYARGFRVLEGVNGTKVCSVCHHHFAKEMFVWRHASQHVGEKPFHCTVCDQRFTRSDTLQRHVRRAGHHGTLKDP